MDTTRLLKVLERLESFNKPGVNDRDFPKFVNYINGFLEYFGQERGYIVGSTAENLKLKWSKEGGDADFLLLSGKFSVPVADLEFRTDFPCYTRVCIDRTKVCIDTDLINDRYLPADILRRVSPDLFTCLRAVYLTFTGNSSNVPRETQHTTIGTASKVGLAVTTYTDLKLDGHVQLKHNAQTMKQIKHDQFRKYIEQRKADSKYFVKDIESIERAIQFISSIKIPGSSGSYLGHFQYFAFVSGKVTDRFKTFKTCKTNKSNKSVASCETLLKDNVDYAGNGKSVVHQNDLSDDDCEQDIGNNGYDNLGNIRATYKDKFHLDFVPALRLTGTLSCMEDWKKRGHRWLSEKEIETTSNMDVFIVARYAPVNPSRKDFSLSFTLAENKLAECMSPVRRQVFLALKACLKGYVTEFHKKHDVEVKLTTYHLKTILYRVSDETDPLMWIETNTYICVVKVLEYLEKSLADKQLLHYFVNSNLYANFDSCDFEILHECINEVRNDPIEAIEAFFGLEDGFRNEEWFTHEEAAEMQTVIDDGGLDGHLDRMEEAILDILRGLNDGPRDADGNSPFLDALKSSLRLFLHDEAMDNFREPGKTTSLPAEIDQLLPHVLPSLTAALGGAIANTDPASVINSLDKVLDTSNSEEEKQRAFEQFKYLVVSYFSR